MISYDICYTGEGALKSGNHTTKQFLTVMDKTSKRDCSEHIKSVKCKPCQKLRRMVTSNVKKQIKSKLLGKTYKMSDKTDTKITKQQYKCRKCKKSKTKKCKLKDYIMYSGAVVGACPVE